MEESFQNLFRGPEEAIDGVHRSHRGHSLAIRLGATLMFMIPNRRRVGSMPYGHSFSIRRFHQDFALFRCRRDRARPTKLLGVRG